MIFCISSSLVIGLLSFLTGDENNRSCCYSTIIFPNLQHHLTNSENLHKTLVAKLEKRERAAPPDRSRRPGMIGQFLTRGEHITSGYTVQFRYVAKRYFPANKPVLFGDTLTIFQKYIVFLQKEDDR